jgi:hypothetical protein
MSTTIQQIQDAYKIIEAKMKANKPMEVLQEFYHDDIIMIQPDQTGGYMTTTGKPAVLEAEGNFFTGLKAMNEHKIVHIALCNSDKPEYDMVAFATWNFDMDVDFGQGVNKMAGDQLSQTYWKDGLVAHERFFNPTTVINSSL